MSDVGEDKTRDFLLGLFSKKLPVVLSKLGRSDRDVDTHQPPFTLERYT